MKSEQNIEHLRHTLAHLLGATILRMYPGAKNTIGPAVDNGFYYDFDFSSVTPRQGGTASPVEKDLIKIEKEMKKLLPTWKEFTHKEVSYEEAKEYFKDNQYKLELIEEIKAKGEKITLYTAGMFTDLCRGGHTEHPSEDINPEAFKISRLAGAYWRGNEKNKMLTRIYGLAYATKEELESYEKQRADAEKRDHKKLGVELDLFTFSELVGAGLPLWTPKGMTLRTVLDDFVWELRKKFGYQKVEIPHITKKELYEKSGHWSKFSDELFKIQTREGHTFVMKPMNCPHHTQIYNRKQWSYRELPQRYANTTMVYRDEQTGELSGLSRVRSITQDDAHVFCRQSQVKEEMSNVWEVVQAFYKPVGFTLQPRISLHDPAKMDKYLGSEEVWKKAEDELRTLVKEKGATAIEALGEAAFYGPKIDFLAKDAIGREWQVATIQLDMNLPERFDLYCINEKSEKERIVMIHCAIMGSIERYASILIEQYAGDFPLWLTPVQVRVLPVRENHNEYAREIYQKLLNAGIRVEIAEEDIGLGKKVRQAKDERVSYFVIVGDKDIEAKKATLESRLGGAVGQFTAEEIVEKIQKEIREKK